MTSPVFQLPKIETLLTGVYGDIKTAKTSFMLSAPLPLVNFDLDQSFDRAVGRLLKINPTLKIKMVVSNGPGLQQADLEQFDIIVRRYNMPMRLPGTVRKGFIELWEKLIMPEFIMAAQHERIRTIGVDTGTLFWTVNHQAQLERAQIDNPTRQSLLPVEYARPNMDTRALYSEVRNQGKNLIALHHVGPKYGPGYKIVKRGNRTEKQYDPDMLLGQTWAGFAHLGQIADVIARTRIERECIKCGKVYPQSLSTDVEHTGHPLRMTEKGKIMPIPTLTIKECGYALEANDYKIIEPTLGTLLGIVNAMRTISTP